MAMMRDHNKKAVIASVVREEMAERISKQIKSSVKKELTEMDMVNRYLHETTARYRLLDITDNGFMHTVEYEEYTSEFPDRWATKQIAIIPNAYGMALFDTKFKLLATYQEGVYVNIIVPQPMTDPTLLYTAIVECLKCLKAMGPNDRNDIGVTDHIDADFDNMIDMVDVWSYEDERINPPEKRRNIAEAIPESCRPSKVREQWDKACKDLADVHKQPKIEECEEDEDE